MHKPERRWRWAVVLWLLQAVPLWAASVEGEALYRERIMPPTGAVLVVSLEETKRAMRLTSGKSGRAGARQGAYVCRLSTSVLWTWVRSRLRPSVSASRARTAGWLPRLPCTWLHPSTSRSSKATARG